MNFNNNKTNCVFRYRFFNENTIAEIINCEIWHATLESLNDPYELPLFFDWSCLEGEDLNKSLALINKQLMLMDPMDKLTSHIAYGKTREAADFMRKSLLRTFNNIENNYKNSLVACFSKEPSDSLMWSHYADGMRGICIAYDIEKLQQSEDFNLFSEVKYTDKVKYFTYRDFKLVRPNKNDNRLVHDYSYNQPMAVTKRQVVLENFEHIFQKHTRWEYEKEIRNVLISPSEQTNGMLIPFQKDAIKAISYGEKIAPTNLHILKLICKEKGISLFKASPKRDDFTVLITKDNNDV
ncbi:hypothetical protein C0W42_08575 [Photobacterium kishitanii]|uniref:DUF2971 domain-containing protein n=1 Tax=Photobacterium kishitanii TaxID=318456 RepID=UPI000D158E14|nr:DUF2971 domain-containing protein [Photobacterium kishitanii]PSU89839.1 hypothetical protein C0W42_08575 [Photobacterium kishitanii]